MTQTLKQQVETLINTEGKMLRTAVYARFELVGKRFIEQALLELATERRIVAGSAEVAPVRAEARQGGDDTPREPRGKRVDTESERLTVAAKVLLLFEPGDVLQPADIMDRLPAIKPMRIREALMRLKASGQLESIPRAGRWLPGDEGPYAS